MIQVNVDCGHKNKPRASHHEARELQQATSGSTLHPHNHQKKGERGRKQKGGRRRRRRQPYLWVK